MFDFDDDGETDLLEQFLGFNLVCDLFGGAPGKKNRQDDEDEDNS